MIKEITGRNNETIKFVAKLVSSSKVRSENELFVAEGLRLCVDAVKSGFKPVYLFFTEQALTANKDLVDFLVNQSDNSYIIENDLIGKITDTVSPQGIVCVFKIPSFDFKFSDKGKYVVLCDIADPANVGAISRTAEALGMDGMIISGGCDVYNPKALRASMGAIFRIKLTKLDVADLFAIFNRHKIKSFASVPSDDATSLKECNFNDGCAMLIGNEANGLSDEIINCCDFKVTIPMKGRAQSLNAAGAAAILMYKMTE